MAYNGKAYHGWQNQPNAISVQEVLEDALSKLLQSPIDIVGAGRTDTGVHALQMFAHFDYDHELDSSHLIYKLNAFLPKDIVSGDFYWFYENNETKYIAAADFYSGHAC